MTLGLALRASLARPLTVGQPPYYWKIMLPGAILGVIVGYATYGYREERPVPA